MNREIHVRFRESLGVKLPRAPIKGREMPFARGNIQHREQAAHSTCTLKRTAQIPPPHAGLPRLIRHGVKGSDLIPAVIDERLIAGELL